MSIEDLRVEAVVRATQAAIAARARGDAKSERDALDDLARLEREPSGDGTDADA